MKECPRCQSVQAWVLGDGRLKCRGCGRRYSWTSVWDSVRLPESAKHALLDAFVRGIPASQCAVDQACADSRERFYRLARACCAKHERVTRDGLSIVHCQPPKAGSRSMMRGWSRSQRVIIVGIVERQAQIQITAPAADAVTTLQLLRERVAVGGLMPVTSTQAYACLQIHGDYVSVPKSFRAPLASQPTEEFWYFARRHLQVFRKIPVKFFQLYLNETCLRFNHRHEDVHALLGNLMASIAIGDLKKLLLGETGRTVAAPTLTNTNVVANLNRTQLCADAG